MRFPRFFLALVLALAATVVVHPAAQASPRAHTCSYYDEPNAQDQGARVCSYPDTRTMKICDIYADGHHPAVGYYTSAQNYWHPRDQYGLSSGQCGPEFTPNGMSGSSWIKFKSMT